VALASRRESAAAPDLELKAASRGQPEDSGILGVNVMITRYFCDFAILFCINGRIRSKKKLKKIVNFFKTKIFFEIKSLVPSSQTHGSFYNPKLKITFLHKCLEEDIFV
jgi:hypothetical protein